MMKRQFLFNILFSLFLILNILFAHGQKESGNQSTYQLKKITEIPHTSVKNQWNTGTCWSFGATSFFESEAIRMNRTDTSLSEMFFVRCAYVSKAINFIRFHGLSNFGEGGQGHDVLDVLKSQGLLPRTIYTGNFSKDSMMDHSVMERKLLLFLQDLMKKEELAECWKANYTTILDEFLGNPPKTFEYQGTSFNPIRFSKEIGIDAEDYIEITSFSHHPYYQNCLLEIPDNWSFNSQYLNLPLNDLLETLIYALQNGFSVLWDGDVTEKEFLPSKSLAIVPKIPWASKSDPEKANTGVYTEEEMTITPAMRQKAFDEFQTTDDHIMHIVGWYRDKQGRNFFKAKNSWGNQRGNGGYIYLSEAYIAYKTIALMLHKKGIPDKIKTKTHYGENINH